MSIYEERLERIRSAVALEKPDKVPVVPCGTSFLAKAAGVKLGDYLSDFELNCTANINGLNAIGNIDGAQATIYTPEVLPTIWLSPVKVPGVGLSDDELWQVAEKETVTQEDYDTILEGGFGPWFQDVLVNRLDDPMKKAAGYFEYLPEANKRFVEAGIPNLCGFSTGGPFEMFCGGRMMENFLMDDLFEIPEKIDEVFKLAQEFNMMQLENTLKAGGVIGGWVGGWRGTPDIISTEMFERFSWPYIKELADLVISYDAIPIFHLDSNWTRGLEYFKQFPKGKCIMALDSKTDIFKAKEIVGDTMCIMGDVSAELMAFGSTQDNYDYVMKLLKEVGPEGYIVSSGCDLPFNGQLENAKMMTKAADDFAKNN